MAEHIVGIACSRAALKDFRYTRGFKFLKDELSQHGCQLEIVIWDQPGTDWGRYSLILVMGLTEYTELVSETLTWLNMVEDLKLPVSNPPSTIRWNMHKGYLLELQNQGVEIPDSVLVRREWKNSRVMSALQEMINKGHKEYIIKPAIGRDGKGVFRADERSLEVKVKKLLLTDDVIIQEYISCVPSNGEICVHFFRGQYNGSCIRKRPIEPESGKININGVDRFIPVDNRVVEVAKDIYAAAKSVASPGEEFLYARVDLMEDLDTGRILLNEFEIFEPLISYDGTNTEAIDLARGIRESIKHRRAEETIPQKNHDLVEQSSPLSSSGQLRIHL